MSWRSPRFDVRRLLPVAAVAALGLTVTPALAATHPAPSLHAVVLVRPGVALPLPVAGGHVLAAFPQVGSELVDAPASALAALARDPRVAGVSPDARGRVAGHDVSATGSGVLAAQELGGAAGRPGTGQGVNVALLDTGVSDTAALNRASGRITDGVDVSHLDADGTADVSGQFTDGYGHGTFLASLIAGGRVPGSGDRAVGVAPSARIVVVKVADSEGNTSLAEVLAGLDWVAAHAQAIQVVNIALAVDRPTAPAYGADPLTAAVEHVRDRGVTVVVAAGNQPGQVGDPGLDPQALTVGAADVTTPDPTVAPFSGSGVVAGVRKPDVVAPGVRVLGVMPADSFIAQHNPGGAQPDGLFRGSGTSEATAITSGVAAAYISSHPGADPVQVKSALRRGAEGMRGAQAGGGLLRMVEGHGNDGSLRAAGESGFDPQAWQDNSWLGVDWNDAMASMWSGPAWDATTWSATTWSATTWSATTWSATTWSATTWSATTWSATTWSATTWSATTWSATTWSDYRWGDDA